MSTARDRSAVEELQRARLAGLLDCATSTPVERDDDSNDPLADLISRTAEIYSRAIHDDTRAAYARRWKRFERWTESASLTPLPASPETVMLFLASFLEADEDTSINTMRGYAAAIGRVHREAGLEAPNDAPQLRQFMRGLARHSEVRPTRRVNTEALRVTDIRRIMRHLEALKTDARATRDAALLGLHAIGLGDGQIARLAWEDLDLLDAGVDIRIRSPRDGSIAIRAVSAATPEGAIAVRALTAWRSLVAPAAVRPVFTAADASGWCGEKSLTPHSIFRIRTTRVDSLAPEDRNPVDAAKLLGGPPSEVLRDRALLLLGFAMSARRGEVVNLRWSDLSERSGGLIAHVRSSKTDLGGRGVDLGIPAGLSELTDPVKAVREWRERVATQLGDEATDGERFVFTHIGRAGRLSESRISPEGLTRLVQRRSTQAGIVGRVGGRSLRAGFITTAAELGIPIDEIARQSRHKTLDSLVLYIRKEDPLLRSPAGEVGL